MVTEHSWCRRDNLRPRKLLGGKLRQGDKGGKGFAGRREVKFWPPTSPHLVSPAPPPKAQALPGLMEECSRLFHPPHRPRHHTVQHRRFNGGRKMIARFLPTCPSLQLRAHNEKRQTQKRKGSDFIASVVDRCTLRMACKSMNRGILSKLHCSLYNALQWTRSS